MPEYSAYRESMAGYTGTPVIKRLVLPEWGVSGERNAESIGIEPTEGTISEMTEASYRELLRLAEEKQVEVSYMGAGDRMTVGTKIGLSCLAPE